MYDDRDLMHGLDGLSTEDEPLTEAELDRLTRQVLRRTEQGRGAKPQRRTRRLWPVWGKALAGGAACVALLAGINGVNPALAESFPVLGDVFAYINALPKGYLQSEQLSDHAQSVQIEAAPGEASQQAKDSMDSRQQDAAAEQPYTLTLSQIYCDELYLRIGLTLSAEDDTLAGFDGVTLEPPLLWEDTTEEKANTLYGGVTLNGEAVSGDLLPYFRKQDDHTFVCEMDYNLQGYTGDTQEMQASLTFSHLVGVKDGSEEKTPLEGTYHIDFKVSADATLTREGRIEGETQNGIRLDSLKATPGETSIQYTVSGPEKTGCYPQILMEDGTELEWVRGIPAEQTESGQTLWTYSFEAVPEEVKTLTVRLLDKNAETTSVLGQWTVTLP